MFLEEYRAGLILGWIHGWNGNPLHGPMPPVAARGGQLLPGARGRGRRKVAKKIFVDSSQGGDIGVASGVQVRQYQHLVRLESIERSEQK
jgi:hypothetical protein